MWYEYNQIIILGNALMKSSTLYNEHILIKKETKNPMSFSENNIQSHLLNQAQHEIDIKQLTKLRSLLAAHGMQTDFSNRNLGYGFNLHLRH